MGSTIVGRTGFDLTKVYHVVITPGGRSSPQEVKLDLPLDVDILFHDHVTIDSAGCKRKPFPGCCLPSLWRAFSVSDSPRRSQSPHRSHRKT
jgi:hypothetical protein